MASTLVDLSERRGMDKEKALESALAQIERSFGKGSIMRLGSTPALDIEAIVDAFERQDFSLETYRKRLLEDSLFRHLGLRTRLARMAYLLNYPWLVRIGWTVARFLVRFTRWRDRNYQPGEAPRLLFE